eukprot:6136060-Pleurochrysis_carterae.AAC.1
MELCVPGGWVQNFSLKSGVNLDTSTLLTISCVGFGDGAPKMHWSKKMCPTPAIGARRVMSSCVDMDVDVLGLALIDGEARGSSA